MCLTMASLTQQIVIIAAVDLYTYSYSQTICKQLGKFVNRKIGCGKRVFALCFCWKSFFLILLIIKQVIIGQIG